jgi:hypothetical protein
MKLLTVHVNKKSKEASKVDFIADKLLGNVAVSLT